MRDDELVGKRIELTAPMQDDPDPIPVGSQGTVTFVIRRSSMIPYDQVSVDWDNGRKLGLASPPDRYRVLD